MSLIPPLTKLLDPSRWARRLEVARLRRLPRGNPGTSTLLGPPFRFADAASFLAQYREIHQADALLFNPDSDHPLILDCGANVGVATAYFKSAFPKARILAFEPDPEAGDCFEANSRSLGWEEVALVRSAVWSQAGPLRFRRVAADAGRVEQTGGQPGDEIAVPGVRLRDYLTERVDLLKLDVEGAEMEVMADLLGHLTDVERIFVEYHSFAGAPQRLGWLLGLLEEEGYRVHVRPAVVSRRPFVDTLDHLGMDLQLNVYASRRAR